MEDLKKLSEEEVVQLVIDGKVDGGDLTDSGICPTCFNRKHNGVLFVDDTDKTLYEDDDVVCFLAGNPRAAGHTIISSKKTF